MLAPALPFCCPAVAAGDGSGRMQHSQWLPHVCATSLRVEVGSDACKHWIY